jgi:hypothetical protein
MTQTLKLVIYSLFTFAMSFSYAGDMAECAKLEDKDQKAFCMASYAASGTYCDQIKNGEMRRDCMFKVVKKQRELSYKVVTKPKPTEEEAK